MTFYWKFVDTLIYNLATIAGVVVGVTQFLIRSFKQNDGTKKVRQVTLQLLKVVDNVVEVSQSKLEAAEVAPVVTSEPTKIVRNRKRKVA